MATTASPSRGKRTPKPASGPAGTAEAAATIAGSVAAAPPKRLSGKSRPASPAPAAEAVAKPPKPNKPKLVRDSFTMPKDEYQVLDVLKRRALGLERSVRKSELLRAGVQALEAMSDRAFLKAIAAVPTLKTGRPKAS
jgi:hypothetical protein